jgi:hypothetical protein
VLGGPAHHLRELGEPERFENVVEGLELERLDGRLNFGVTGDNDDLTVLAFGTHALHDLDPVLFRDAQVEEDDIELFPGERRQRRLTVNGGRDEVLQPGQSGDEGVAKVGIVLDEEQSNDVGPATVAHRC